MSEQLVAEEERPSGEPAGPQAPPRSADVLRALGMDALVEILENTGYGVCVTGENHTWTYLNPAGERIIGATFEELYGRDYLLSFAEHERAALLALEGKQREGDAGFYVNTVQRPDGTELQMTWSGTGVEVDGVELAPAIFHETTSVRRAQREASELGAGAARLAEGGSAGEVLTALVREAVEVTRACGASLLVQGPDGPLRVLASHGLPETFGTAVATSPARLADLPAGTLLTRGRGGFLSDDRERLLAHPPTRPWAESLDGVDWLGATKLPVHGADGEVAGCLVVLLPSRITSPDEAELLLWESLAEQAGSALRADQVRNEISRASTLMERERIARDLHDSVNHALFGLQARAQVVRRALERDDPHLAREAAHDLEDLARQATTEMRALLDELRPQVAAGDLRQQLAVLADVVRHRDGLAVRMSLPGEVLPAFDDATTEHLCRIVGESLHNTVKHAGATAATVTGAVDHRHLTLTVSDDGRGFDTGVGGHVGHGRRTMRERARLCGGDLTVVSRPGQGTTVTVTVPLPA
ncbi:histidine kinase [Georgenia subflava]|uniref:PAS domain S-box protein n=1 Tax=Georgenia subflava TaxID=1622177 RepID=A0A6N7EHS0_9MICO|nr:histidine kinase [Georgenia subflava]MPV36663.1 PAS domain S-box protein [Georgenia subflava]